MFDINKVSINDLETLLKVMTSGIATYDYILLSPPSEGKPAVVDITIRANERTCVYVTVLGKASLAQLENKFLGFYRLLNIPDPEIEYKKRRYYLYS
jgi:hypothetical protein